jgi:hypothetical protein
MLSKSSPARSLAPVLQTFIQEASDHYQSLVKNYGGLPSERMSSTNLSASLERTRNIADAFVIFGQLKASYDPRGTYVSGFTELPVVQINSIYLKHAVCAFTDYTGLHFRGGTFEECGLIHSLLTGAFFYDCTFSNTSANYSDFEGCHFFGCTFKGKTNDFRQAILRGTVFENTKFVDGGRICLCDISGADFTKCPDLVPENIVDCAALSNNPPKFPAGVEIEYRKIDPEKLGDIDPALEFKWFVWSNALKIFPREEAMYRAHELGIDHDYFLLRAFGELKGFRLRSGDPASHRR